MPQILVVDDRRADAESAMRLLHDVPDWTVTTCADADAALRHVSRSCCDLVVTDLHMPGVDGLHLMHRLHEQLPTLPVIVVTSRGDESKAVKALDAGASSYLPKSWYETHLVATCKRVLDSARLRRDRAELMDHLVEERFEISVENDRQHVPALVDFIVGRCVQFEVCDSSRSPRIGVAIEEAVINAMIHGNLEVSSELREDSYENYEQMILTRLSQPEFSNRRVRIQVTVERDQCRIRVRDDGPGFNQDELRDPTDPENLSRVSGRGIMLMRAFLDQVTFNDRGNEVLLVIDRGDAVHDAVAERDATTRVSAVV